MPAVAPTPIPDLPAAPARLVDPPAAYVPKADAWAGALPAWTTAANAEAAKIYANALAAEAAANSAELDAAAAAQSAFSALQAVGLVRRVTNNLAVGAGAKNLTGLNAPAAASFYDGLEVALVYSSDHETLQWGVASAANMAAGTMTVTVAAGDFAGAGPQADWLVVPRFYVGLLAATAAEIRAGTTNTKGRTPAGDRAANAPVAQAYASTVTIDASAGKRRTLTASASFTLGAPTNCAPGDVIEVDVTNSAGGVVLAVNAALKRQGGLGLIGPNNGDRSLIVILVQEVDGSNTCTRGIYAIARTPS